VCAKKLEKGRFHWPTAGDAQGKIVLSHEESAMLLGGIDLGQARHRKWYRRPVAGVIKRHTDTVACNCMLVGARKGLTCCLLEKFHERLRIVEHDIVTALDCMDDPGRIIFKAIVELSEWARELRHPDSHNKHPLLHL
jgi:hypothetical protein